jgi:hypothetical protein
MSVWYDLVNQSRQEYVSWDHLPCATASEIIGYEAATMLVTYYLFRCLGDHIAFVGDAGPWPFPTGNRADLQRYHNISREILDEMATYGWLTVHEQREENPLDHDWYRWDVTVLRQTTSLIRPAGLPATPPWGHIHPPRTTYWQRLQSAAWWPFRK